jgi:fibronectin-binding autotransporter adhesin
MKIPNPTPRMQSHPASVKLSSIPGHLWLFLLLVAGLLGAVSAQAATMIWTNAPVDNYFNNTNNWVGRVAPGASNSSANADVAFFTSAIPISGIGGAGNAITNEFMRSLGGFVFDTATCGAYVFGNSTNDNFVQIRGIATVTTNFIVGPAVVNPINFNQPIRFVVPSSTNLRIDITNNATSPNATLFFAAITNSTASTRPLDFYLSGSNTGTNTIARIDDQVGGAGAIRIFKEGAGLWILSSSNDLPQKTSAGNPAVVYVEGGTLEVKDPGSLGVISAANLVVQNSGTLQIDGISLNNNGVTLRNGGTLKINGVSTNNGLYMGNAPGTSVTVATTGASDTLIVSTNTGGALDTVVHVNGPGTVVLDQLSTYLGKWSVDAGTLQLSNAAALGTGANANLNIAAGAIFDTTPIGATTCLLPGSLSANGAGTAVGSTASTIRAAVGGTVSMATGLRDITLTYNPATFTGDLTRPALYISQGTLSISGNAFIVNNTSGTALGVGTYRLIEQASGNITSGGGYAAIVLGSGLATGTVGTIQVTGGNVNLLVTAYTPQNLTWLGGLNNNAWDAAISVNWTNGLVGLLFNTADNVTFDATGVVNSSVVLSNTLVPGSVTVDTSAGNYTFGGNGLITGTAGLTKINSGTLAIQTVNTYRSGTVVSNGTLQVGVNDAVPCKGPGNVAVVSPGILDLNGFNDTINALTGNGTVNNAGAGAAVLTVGYNDNSGTFAGALQNSSGSLGLTKIGQGVETLSSASTYAGPTTVNAGILKVANINALGSGASPVTVNAGMLDANTDVNLDSLQASYSLSAVITNSTAATNTLIIRNTSTNTSTFDGLIVNGTTGRLRVLVTSGTFRMDGVLNTYSNGTYMAEGTTLAIGAISGSVATSGRAGTAEVIASNNVTINLATALSTAANMPNNVITVDGATVNFTSASLGNGFGGNFIGGLTATNVYTGQLTLTATTTAFSNFLGTVLFTNVISGTGTRWMPGTASLGGDNTRFVLLPNAGFFSRDGSGSIRLGSLEGSGSIGGPTFGGTATWIIGARNNDMVFSGGIYNGGTGNAGSAETNNSIVKAGTGKLTLDGGVFTNVWTPDGFIYYTNLLATNSFMQYAGPTIISNGILKLVVPIVLTNTIGGAAPTPITLASATAVLDATSMGYTSNEFDSDGITVTNCVRYTNGVIVIVTNQHLSGVGTIWGNVVADPGSVINPGYTALTRAANGTMVLTNGPSTGTLTVTTNLSIAGVVNVRLNRTNAVNSSRLAAQSFTISPTATLTVTNFGPALQGGEVFTLFNQPVTGFASISLPSIAPFTWTDNLAINGTLVVSLSTNPNLTALVITPAGALSPAFNSNTLSYATTFAYTNSAITVTPTDLYTTSTNKVIYNGVTNIVASGTASASLALNPNPGVTNVVKIEVTAQDGVNVKTYVVNVARLASLVRPQIANSFADGNLTLTWPVSNTTYRLQAQTNTTAVGITTNWVDWAGAKATNQVIVPIDQANGTVFFRLIYP